MAGGVFRDGTGRLRTVWRFLIFLVAGGAVQFALGMGVIVWWKHLVPASAQQPLLFLAVSTPVTSAGTLAVVYVCRRRLDRRSLTSLGLGRPEARLTASPWLGLALGGGAALAPILALLALGSYRIAALNVSPAPLVFLAVLAVAAFGEEVQFRGYLLTNMAEAGHRWAGLLLVSALFMLAHCGNPGFWATPLNGVNILCMALLLGVAYLLSGNLWFVTALHLGWNAMQGVVFGLPVSGIPGLGLLRLDSTGARGEFWTGGSFGLEGSPLVLPPVLVLLAFLLALLLKRPRMRARPPAGPEST
jgi:membrane protease YdiL (CAAX protease family)